LEKGWYRIDGANRKKTKVKAFRERRKNMINGPELAKELKTQLCH